MSVAPAEIKLLSSFVSVIKTKSNESDGKKASQKGKENETDREQIIG